LCIFIKFRSIYCLCSMIILSSYFTYTMIVGPIVRSGRPVVVPVQCPKLKTIATPLPPKLKVPEPPQLSGASTRAVRVQLASRKKGAKKYRQVYFFTTLLQNSLAGSLFLLQIFRALQ